LISTNGTKLLGILKGSSQKVFKKSIYELVVLKNTEKNLQYIIQTNTIILKEMDNATLLMQIANEKKISNLVIIIFIGLSFSSTL